MQMTFTALLSTWADTTAVGVAVGFRAFASAGADYAGLASS